MMLDVYFFFIFFLPWTFFIHKAMLACRSVRQLSSLIRCLAGSGIAGMGVLVGIAAPGTRQGQGTDVEGEAGPVWGVGYKLDLRQMKSERVGNG